MRVTFGKIGIRIRARKSGVHLDGIRRRWSPFVQSRVEFDWARVRRSVFRMLARRKKHLHVDMPCLFLSDVLAVHHNNLAPLNNKVRKTNLKQLIQYDTKACDHYLIPQDRFRQEVWTFNVQLRTEAINH